ncbi:MAG: hypothetical protein OEU57_07995, partial [Desulfuromonadales bacterium]|nr:hypothetical protein [Desulfuromonadales bacterium]
WLATILAETPPTGEQVGAFYHAFHGSQEKHSNDKSRASVGLKVINNLGKFQFASLMHNMYFAKLSTHLLK